MPGYVDRFYDDVALEAKDIRDTHIREMMAEEFSTLKDYAFGDYTVYDAEFYKFIVDHAAGIWNPNHVMKTTVAYELELALAKEDADRIDAIFAAMLNGMNTTKVFKTWWPLSDVNSATRYARLCRFARIMQKAGENLTYTLRASKASGSDSADMTPMDDLVNVSPAQLCTDATTPVADAWDEGLIGGWYVRANALSLADGTMDIKAVEGVDTTFDITGELAPVYTFAPALFIKQWSDDNYWYKSWRIAPATGYTGYAGDTAPNNVKRDITWHPTFPGGYNSDGYLSSGAGQKPFNRQNANSGISSARNVSAYEGLWNDADTIHVLDMWQLRHFKLGNSGVCEGCQSYNFQYTVAKAETGVKRVLLTSAQAANLQVGSNLMCGTHPEGTNTDRNTAANYNIFDNAKITSIEDITIDGTDYKAVNVDTAATFDVPATGYISTAPWSAGNTENLSGHKDGACYSLTAGRNPMRVMGIEVMDGAYTIGLDPLYNVTNFADGKGDYEVFECKDSTKQTGSITSDYVSTGITYSQMPQGWQYVKDFVITLLSVLFPNIIGGSSSIRYKDAFCGAASAGVRCPWRFGVLYHGASAGLACEYGNYSPLGTSWFGRPRLSGSGKIRG